MMSLWTLLIEQLNTQHQQQCLAALKSCFILILVLETGVPKIMTALQHYSSVSCHQVISRDPRWKHIFIMTI